MYIQDNNGKRYKVLEIEEVVLKDGEKIISRINGKELFNASEKIEIKEDGEIISVDDQVDEDNMELEEE